MALAATAATSAPDNLAWEQSPTAVASHSGVFLSPTVAATRAASNHFCRSGTSSEARADRSLTRASRTFVSPSLLEAANDMKVPPATDPRWGEFVQCSRDYRFKCLASRIMLGQVRLLAQRDPKRAAQLAYEFFVKNESLAAEDLQT